MNSLFLKTWAEREFGPLDGLVQGIAVSIVIGTCAQFLSEHYDAPAMAIATVLPKNAHLERNLLFTVLSVTETVFIASFILSGL